jgi:hypothetical protein
VKVNGFLIESFVLADQSSVTADAVLCEFDEPRYLGIRRTPSVHTVEPSMATDPDASFATTRFPERQLLIEEGRRPAFSYSEPWSLPSWSLYVVAPPPGFHAQTLRLLDRMGEARTLNAPRLHVHDVCLPRSRRKP